LHTSFKQRYNHVIKYIEISNASNEYKLIQLVDLLKEIREYKKSILRIIPKPGKYPSLCKVESTSKEIPEKI